MATQKGRNWSSGDIVTAANLSSIERGVSAVAEEYTPTTWANGNTVTAAGLNNIEQGIANAGGGSSDFSTAEVIITDTVENATISNGIIVYPNELGTVEFHTSEGANPITLLLYKGIAQLSFVTASPITEYSGNFSIDEAEQDDGSWYTYVSITGDCSVTVTGEGLIF